MKLYFSITKRENDMKIWVVTRAFQKVGLTQPQIQAELSAYGIQTNSHAIRIFNLQQGLVDMKTGQSNVKPNKEGTSSWWSFKTRYVQAKSLDYMD